MIVSGPNLLPIGGARVWLCHRGARGTGHGAGCLCEVVVVVRGRDRVAPKRRALGFPESALSSGYHHRADRGLRVRERRKAADGQVVAERAGRSRDRSTWPVWNRRRGGHLLEASHSWHLLEASKLPPPSGKRHRCTLPHHGPYRGRA